MRRETVLENNTSYPLALKELQEHALDGCYGHETRLDPGGVRLDFPATLYKDRNRDSGRASEVVILAGGGEAERSLFPEVFTKFVKLIFELDDGRGHLVVYGIRPRLTDICCLSGFGFLGQDYNGRPKVVILRTRILRVPNKKAQ